MKNVFALQDGVTTPEKAENCGLRHETERSDIPGPLALFPPFLRLRYPPAAGLPVDSKEQRN